MNGVNVVRPKITISLFVVLSVLVGFSGGGWAAEDSNNDSPGDVEELEEDMRSSPWDPKWNSKDLGIPPANPNSSENSNSRYPRPQDDTEGFTAPPGNNAEGPFTEPPSYRDEREPFPVTPPEAGGETPTGGFQPDGGWKLPISGSAFTAGGAPLMGTAAVLGTIGVAAYGAYTLLNNPLTPIFEH